MTGVTSASAPPVGESNGFWTATPCAVTLDADLGWALGAVFRRYVEATRAAMADLPGGPRGYQVLAAAASGHTANQLALAQRLGIDRTVMTYLLDDLERADLVERRPDPADRRARRIAATEAGQTALSDVHQRLQQAEQHLLEALDDDERRAFRALLQRVASHAHAVDPLANPCDAVEELDATDRAPAHQRRRPAR
jgi:DNA-binding MarR family transcriptional regulator